jgi:5-oxoprolinase (ATP-hydrolysing)
LLTILKSMQAEFEAAHRQRYSFIMPEKPLIVEAVSVEVVERMDVPEASTISPSGGTGILPVQPISTVQNLCCWRVAGNACLSER